MRFAAHAFRISMQTLNNDACLVLCAWDPALYKNREQNPKSRRKDEGKEREISESR